MNDNRTVFYGIGVGPGEAGLLTVKAKRIIEEVDIIVLPAKDKDSCRAYQIVEKEIPSIKDKQCECMPFPMSMMEEERGLFHQNVASRVETYLDEGKNVAFLTIGDVSIYSTFDYVEAIVRADGYLTQYISGIPSFCAAAAKLGIPLVLGDEELHIIPGGSDCRRALSLGGTLVFMKSGKKLLELKQVLVEAEKDENLDVRAVSNCGMQNEEITLGAKNLKAEQGYLTVVIVRRNS